MTDEPPRTGDETFVLRINASNTMDQVFQRFLMHYTPFGFQSRMDQLEYHPLPYLPKPSYCSSSPGASG